MIELRHVNKTYGDNTLLRDINVTIRDGDIVSVIGPSGAGKSTLIRCINLLEKPTSGQILINGADITAKDADIAGIRKKIGMVFQSFNLFDHLTVLENVMNPPMQLLGFTRDQAHEKAMELLRTVGLEGRAFQYPRLLSGGQKQRVSIARMLSMDPDVILLDEPMSALDPAMVGEVQSVIRELSKTGKTMIIVTNEVSFVREICNRVLYLDQGGIYEEGTPEEIFDHPQKELTRRFVHRLRVFEATFTGADDDFLGVFGEMERYCYKNLIPSRACKRIQLVMEELCHEVLIPQIAEPCVSFVVEYAEKSGKASVIVRYNGEPFDPRDSDNIISLKLIMSMAEFVEYAQIDENGFTNQVTLSVSSGVGEEKRA